MVESNEIKKERTTVKKFIFAFFAYLVLVFIIATAWHIGFFKEAYLNANLRAQPIFALGILSMLIQAAVVSYLYPRLAGEGSPAKEGVKFGLILGILLGSYGVLAEAGKYDVGPVPTFLFLEGAFFLIQYAIVGTVIGLIYGKPSKEN